MMNNDVYRNKIGQIYDTLRVRFGIMLVGPAMSGKTQMLKRL